MLIRSNSPDVEEGWDCVSGVCEVTVNHLHQGLSEESNSEKEKK